MIQLVTPVCENTMYEELTTLWINETTGTEKFIQA